jgi:ADP-heptose:LPS heptosyltransferase
MSRPDFPHRHILVIKLAALGDVVQAFGPFEAIRAAHPDARITLLTTPPYAAFLGASPWFDDIWVDTRPRALAAGAWLALRRRLIAAQFDRVYDLQTSDRSSAYYRLFWPGPRPDWSGIARGCSHPHANPDRDSMHTIERQREQLEMAGVGAFPDPKTDWLVDNATASVDGPYALIVPGGSAGRPRKRWPAERFAQIAAAISERGLTPVLIGGEADRGATGTVAENVPEVCDLTGRTTLFDIFALGCGAEAAIGNDTGPMHLIARAGCPTTVLFSDDSNPDICAPRGRSVRIVKAVDLADVSVADAAENLGI